MENVTQNIDKAISHISDIISLLSKGSLASASSSTPRNFGHNSDSTKNSQSNELNSFEPDMIDHLTSNVLMLMDLLMKTSRLSISLQQRETKTVQLITEMKSTIIAQSNAITSYKEKFNSRVDESTSTDGFPVITERHHDEDDVKEIIFLKDLIKDMQFKNSLNVENLERSRREEKKLRSALKQSRLIIEAQQNQIDGLILHRVAVSNSVIHSSEDNIIYEDDMNEFRDAPTFNKYTKPPLPRSKPRIDDSSPDIESNSDEEDFYDDVKSHHSSEDSALFHDADLSENNAYTEDNVDTTVQTWKVFPTLVERRIPSQIGANDSQVVDVEQAELCENDADEVTNAPLPTYSTEEPEFAKSIDTKHADMDSPNAYSSESYDGSKSFMSNNENVDASLNSVNNLNRSDQSNERTKSSVSSSSSSGIARNNVSWSDVSLDDSFTLIQQFYRTTLDRSTIQPITKT